MPQSRRALVLLLCATLLVGDPTPLLAQGTPSPAPAAWAVQGLPASPLPLTRGEPRTLHQDLLDLDGSLVLAFQDVSIPARGLPLALGRVYRSGLEAAGALGPGWSWTYGLRLVPDPLTGRTRLIEEDGTETWFGPPGEDGVALPLSGHLDGALLRRERGRTLRLRQDGRADVFDRRGRLIERLDARGVALRLNYDGQCPVSVTDAAGRALTFSWSDGRLVAVADPLGRVTRYAYEAGRLASVVDPLGRRTRFAWEGPRLREVTLADGVQITVSYNGRGEVERLAGPGELETLVAREASADGARLALSLTDALGGTTRVEVERSAGQATLRVTDPSGGRTEATARPGEVRVRQGDGPEAVVTIDGLGRPVRVRDATGDERDLSSTEEEAPPADVYDARGYPRHLTLEDGLAGAPTFDEAGRLLRLDLGGGRATRFEWDAGDRLVRRIDPDGTTVEATHDAADRPLRRVGPEGEARWRWDARGCLLERVLPGEPEATSFEWDRAARLVAITQGKRRRTFERAAGDLLLATRDEDGREERFTWHADGRLLAATAGDGRRFTFAHDAAGRPIGWTGPQGEEHRVEVPESGVIVHAAGDVLDLLHPDGARERREHDAAGRLVRRTWRGRVDAWTRDAEGRVVGHARGGVETVLTRDAQGRVVAVEGPLRAHLEDDGLVITTAAGAWRTERDAGGEVVARTDPLGGVTRVERQGRTAAVVDPAGRRVLVERDEEGRVVAFGPPGVMTRFAHDGAGAIRTVVSPGGRALEVARDDAGRVAAVRTGEVTLARWTYDARGLPTSVEDGVGRHAFVHDETGRLVRVVDAFGRAMSYAYDARGRLATVIGPGGEVTRYRHDDEGVVTGLVGPDGRETAVARDAAGRVREVVYPGGVRIEVGHGPDGRLSSLRWRRGDDVLLDRALARDDRGRVVAITQDGRAARLERDPLGQLLRVEVADDPLAAAFDGSGALTSLRGLALATDASYRLTRAGERVVRTDPDGNLSEIEGLLALRHDALGRVVEVTPQGGPTISLRYDFAGRLVERRAGEEVVRYAHDGGHVIAAYDGDGRRLAWFERLPTGPLAVRLHGGDATSLLLCDELGTPVAHVDGAAVRPLSCDAWGRWQRGPPPTHGAIGWTAAPFEPATGLVLLPARAYLPEVGQFVSPDPGGLPGGVHPYAYAHGDPVSFRDPTGREPAEPSFDLLRGFRPLIRPPADVAAGLPPATTLPDPAPLPPEARIPEHWTGVRPRENFSAWELASGHEGSARGRRIPLEQARPGPYRYIVDLDGRVWLDRFQLDGKHSWIANPGEPVRGAGELAITTDGVVHSNARSGHYVARDPFVPETPEAKAYARAMRETIARAGFKPGEVGAGGEALPRENVPRPSPAELREARRPVVTPRTPPPPPGSAAGLLGRAARDVIGAPARIGVRLAEWAAARPGLARALGGIGILAGVAHASYTTYLYATGQIGLGELALGLATDALLFGLPLLGPAGAGLGLVIGAALLAREAGRCALRRNGGRFLSCNE
ncbi:MAG: DUF6531 domain-containing protein [Planctomycetes bacterium]|nr:DUF6531 domain-containing protein [Planctomycetota bacterium]